MPRLKQIITALILLIIISIPCMLFVYYQSAQWFIRYAMEEKLEKQQLHTLHIPVKDVHWYKKNKEIIVDGRLFDIKSVVIDNDVAVFTGLYDEEETAIKKKLENFKNKGNKDSNRQSAKKYISILLFAEEKHKLLFSLVDPLSIIYSSYHKDNLISGDISIPSPPPKA